MERIAGAPSPIATVDVDDDRMRPRSGRQIKVTLQVHAIVGSIGDVFVDFEFLLGCGHGDLRFGSLNTVRRDARNFHWRGEFPII
jgi:hypothetical protein